MFIDFLLDIFKNNDKTAFIYNDRYYSYKWLFEKISFLKKKLIDNGILEGEVVSIESVYCPEAVALFLACIENQNIIVPLTISIERKKKEYYEIAQVEKRLTLLNNDNLQITPFQQSADHELYSVLRELKHPGLILFSSGTSGKSKAAVHDFVKLLQKYRTPRKDYRTLAFMLFDHIGGVDTLFYSLSNGSTITTIEDRSPEAICQAIEKYNIEVLPVTPTFLNLLILSEAYKRYDMSSLKYITYGTEVMPEYLLRRTNEIFPGIEIMQKYGTTEVGTLRSKSKDSNSTWVKLGGEGYQTRVIDGILQIKAESSMLGYLNADSPFTKDGWFITGDEVIVDGEYLRILGRKSEIINVGGEKVYPAEVENVIQQIDNISEVTVYGEKNPIMGNIVAAKISLLKPVANEKEKGLIKEIKKHCAKFLEQYKVPVKIKISHEEQYTERFKKKRYYDDKL